MGWQETTVLQSTVSLPCFHASKQLLHIFEAQIVNCSQMEQAVCTEKACCHNYAEQRQLVVCQNHIQTSLYHAHNNPILFLILLEMRQ